MDFRSFKEYASERLEGKWVMVVIGTIIFWLISGQLFSATENSRELFGGFEFSTNFSNLLSLIFTGPMTLGYFIFLKRIIRDEGDYGPLFDGFRRFGDTFIYHLLTSILIVLGIILLIVPGIFFAISYSMGYLIMKDNEDLTATEAMRQSWRMMEGHRWDYLGFAFSFIGWFLLAIITFGLGFLFLTPYFNTAKIAFYEKLKEVQVQE